MMTILEKILGRQRVRVNENERAIALYKGEIRDILGPGEHWMQARGGSLEIVRHDLKTGDFTSPYEKALFAKLPDVAARHLTVIRTGRSEVAVVERDGNLVVLLAPERKLVLWTDAGPWTAQIVDTSADLAIERKLL